MNKILTSIFITLTSFSSINILAQGHLLTPSDADIIVSMKGENLFDKVSIEEMKSTPVINEMFQGLTQMLGEKESEVNELGIDLKSEAQYFLKFQEEGNILMGTTFKLDNAEKFQKIFFADAEIKNKNGVQFVVTDGYTKAIKGDKGLVTYSVITPKYKEEDSYYYSPETEVEELIFDEEYYEEIPQMDYEMEEPEVAEPEYEIEEDEVEIVEEIIEQEYVDEVIEEEIVDYYAIYEEEQRIKNEEIGIVSQAFALELFASSTPPLNLAQKKIDANADFSILMNSYSGFYQYVLMNQYSSPYGYRDPFEKELNKMMQNLYSDFEWLSINGFYDKDELRIETNSKFSGELAKWYEGMLDSNINPKMLNYIPFDDHLAFMSGALNTKALIDGYYDYTRSISDAIPEMDGMDIGQNVGIIMDLVEMFVDEDAIANMYKGDFYAGITDINSYQVEYTTYEYDDDWNYKEITKTKEEVRPDFLIMFSSDDTKNINNIFKLLEINSNGMFQNKGDYYMMPQGREIPLDIYAMQKEGMVFIFTSQALFDFIAKGGKKPTAAQKSLLNESSTFMQLKGSELAEKIPLTDLPGDMKSLINFMRDNSGDLSFTQKKMKDNVLSAHISLTTKGEHKNSLAYFIYMINEAANMGKSNSTYRN